MSTPINPIYIVDKKCACSWEKTTGAYVFKNIDL